MNWCLIQILLCFQVLPIAVTGMDGTLGCFMTFSTVFQSYQDDEWVIIKGCVQWKSRKENPQKPTQLSSRSHPRHLVGKRTAQKTPS